jgi:hypothetical protein
MDALLETGGFEAPDMERGYASGPRVAAYLYRGVARPGASGRTAPAPRPRQDSA